MWLRRTLFLAGSFFSSVNPLLACAVCFGSGSADQVKGFTWGILILLILPFFLVSCFILYIGRAQRRKTAHE